MRRDGLLSKPAVYLAALRSGEYHWGTLADDSPVTVEGWSLSQNTIEKSRLPHAGNLQRLESATARLGRRLAWIRSSMNWFAWEPG